jgi:hypothetical protein
MTFAHALGASPKPDFPGSQLRPTDVSECYPV